MICSVVPEELKVLKPLLRKRFSGQIGVVGRNVRVPMLNRYRNPRQVGQDRLVGAYAGTVLYGSPLIVVDLGTAVTLDVVSHKKEYLGGASLGLQLPLESVAEFEFSRQAGPPDREFLVGYHYLYAEV